MLVWGRLREVEVHHVDLDAGYRPADWPEAFAPPAAARGGRRPRRPRRRAADGAALRRQPTRAGRSATGTARPRSPAPPPTRRLADRPRPPAPGWPSPPTAPCRTTGMDIDDLMTYTGDVTPGGPPAVRELTELTITKVSVGPMDNNAYLLRCRATGEQVLIDAANEAPTGCSSWSATAGCPPWSPPTSTSTTGWRWRRWSPRPGARSLAHADDAPGCRSSGRDVADGDTRARSARCALEVIHLVGHTPGSIALLYRDPARHPAPVHRRLALPRRGRQHRRRPGRTSPR